MKTWKLLLMLLMVTPPALYASIAMSGRGRQAASTPAFTQWSFGMVGITRAQTVRVNVVFAPGSRSCPADPSRVETVEIGFVDSAGNSLVPVVQRTLRAGQATLVDIDWGDIPSGAAIRVEIRPVVRLPVGSSCLIANVEVFDVESGRTEAVYAGLPPFQHNYNAQSDEGVVRFTQNQ